MLLQFSKFEIPFFLWSHRWKLLGKSVWHFYPMLALNDFINEFAKRSVSHVDMGMYESWCRNCLWWSLNIKKMKTKVNTLNLKFVYRSSYFVCCIVINQCGVTDWRIYSAMLTFWCFVYGISKTIFSQSPPTNS